MQRIPPLSAGATAECERCDTTLERTAGRSAGAALALAGAAFALFLPGNVLPAMRSELLGAAVESRPIDGAYAYFSDGWPIMAALVAVFVVIVPMLRAAMLVAVLGALRLGVREREWQGRLFRVAEALRGWSMAQVFLAAGAVTYSRVSAQLDVEVLPGGWCFVAGTVLLMVAEASLDRRRVWTAIRADAVVSPDTPAVGCSACLMVLPAEREGEPCPRCARTLHAAKPDSLQRTTALTLASVFLLYPAYALPMVVSVQPNGVMERTILDGVAELFDRGFWYLGVLVFLVSVGIPAMKLVALTWLTLSVRFPHWRALRLRTRVHRFVDEINHWSFVDPFIVALNAAMMAYPGIVSVQAGAGALPFALVVVLTMIASRTFDARLMWAAAEARK